MRRFSPHTAPQTPEYKAKVYLATSLQLLAAQLAKTGVSAADLLARVGLDEAQIAAPETRVSLEQTFRFFELVAERTQDPCVAFKAGLKFHLAGHGLPGLAVLTSRDYRQALTLAARYARLATPLCDFAFSEDAGEAVWTFEPAVGLRTWGPAYPFVVWFHLGVFAAMRRELMGRSLCAAKITLAFNPPASLATADRAHGWPATSRGAKNTVRFGAACLDDPIRMASPSVNQLLVKICDEQLDEFQRLEGFSGRVRAALIASGLRQISAEAVARAMGLSERSLRRRLQAEDASFQAILMELRLQAAIEQLRDTSSSVEQIAEAVGFSDAANFRRAFRRWTGTTPSALRNGE